MQVRHAYNSVMAKVRRACILNILQNKKLKKEGRESYRVTVLVLNPDFLSHHISLLVSCMLSGNTLNSIPAFIRFYIGKTVYISYTCHKE